VTRKRERQRRAEDEVAGPVANADIKQLTDRIATGEMLDAPSVRTLQRTAGNQAVLRLGPGQPLDPRTRSRMESAFQASFADVRTHAGPDGAALAREQNAAAFAVGTDIVLGDRAPKPGTVEGDVLLAHELAHVEQQRGAEAAVLAKSLGDVPDSALEKDANRSAFAAVSSLWGDVRQNAKPALKSGVRLSKFCIGGGGNRQQSVEGNAGTVQSDEITVNIDESERGIPFSRDSPNLEIKGSVGGVDSGFAELYRIEGNVCNEVNAVPPDPVWRVPVVNGRFRMMMSFAATVTPAWGQTIMIKAGDGTRYNTACSTVVAD
jgi:hypothetical protein